MQKSKIPALLGRPPASMNVLMREAGKGATPGAPPERNPKGNRSSWAFKDEKRAAGQAQEEPARTALGHPAEADIVHGQVGIKRFYIRARIQRKTGQISARGRIQDKGSGQGCPRGAESGGKGESLAIDSGIKDIYPIVRGFDFQTQVLDRFQKGGAKP